MTQVYKRLQEIDAYGAEARAATILAGLSFDNSMQVRPRSMCILRDVSYGSQALINTGLPSPCLSDLPFRAFNLVGRSNPG